MIKILAVGVLLVGTTAFDGQETHCIGYRAHKATYQYDAESLEVIENMAITIERDAASDSFCGDAAPSDLQNGRDKSICIGANVDSSCANAAKDVPLVDKYVDCPSCFASAETDLFYKINVSHRRLQSVEVGLQKTHLRGAAELHAGTSGSKAWEGRRPLISNKTAGIHFKIAKLIPVDITVSMPTSLDFSLDVSGEIDAFAGADVDVNLGDHYVRWVKGTGFSSVDSAPNVTVTPVIKATGSATADLQLTLSSSAQIDIDKVMWYHLDMLPAMPVKVDMHAGLPVGQKRQVCAATNPKFTMNHEADVHFTLLKKDHDFHFGPKELYHHEFGEIKKCLPAEPELVVV